MAKPYRVKRAGRYIGSWLLVVDGQRINLGTKDATEARRRARLAEAGKWPPGDPAEEAADGIQAALASEIGGDEPSMADVEPPAPAVAPAATAALPVSEVLESPAESGPPLSAVDAANAAAVDLAGQVKDALHAEGVDLAELQAEVPDLCAAGHLWAQGQAARGIVWAFKGKFPPLVSIEKGNPMRAALGRVWMVLLARWDMRPETWGPGTLLLVLSAVTGMAQITAGFEAVSGSGETPQGGQG